MIHSEFDPLSVDRLDRYLSSSDLLPPAVEVLRQETLVVDSLSAKRHPRAHEIPDIQGRPGDYEALLKGLAPQRLGVLSGHEPGEQIYFLDKTFPHAQFEVMFMAVTPEVKPSLYDLTPPMVGDTFQVMATFAEYAELLGLYPHISWSYDPDTSYVDRPSGQGAKWHHTHMVARTPLELLDVQDRKQAVSSLPQTRQRRLVDETAVVMSNLLSDILIAENPGLSALLLPPFAEGNASPVMKLRLPEGWDTLRSESLAGTLAGIHQTILREYSLAWGIIGDGYKPNRNWYFQSRGAFNRPNFVNPDITQPYLLSQYERRGVRAESLLMMQKMLAGFRPELVSRIRQNPSKYDRDILSHVLPLAGPSYSTAIARDGNGELAIYLRPYLFSDLGGAGLAYIHDITVKTKKGVGTYEDDEIATREQFQRNFISRLEL